MFAPQEEVAQQQEGVSALPASMRPPLSQRQSLGAQYLQHRLQVGPPLPRRLREASVGLRPAEAAQPVQVLSRVAA